MDGRGPPLGSGRFESSCWPTFCVHAGFEQPSVSSAPVPVTISVAPNRGAISFSKRFASSTDRAASHNSHRTADRDLVTATARPPQWQVGQAFQGTHTAPQIPDGSRSVLRIGGLQRGRRPGPALSRVTVCAQTPNCRVAGLILRAGWAVLRVQVAGLRPQRAPAAGLLACCPLSQPPRLKGPRRPACLLGRDFLAPPSPLGHAPLCPASAPQSLSATKGSVRMTENNLPFDSRKRRGSRGQASARFTQEPRLDSP